MYQIRLILRQIYVVLILGMTINLTVLYSLLDRLTTLQSFSCSHNTYGTINNLFIFIQVVLRFCVSIILFEGVKKKHLLITLIRNNLNLGL